jgi:oligopeptide transport system substrate-binding protein
LGQTDASPTPAQNTDNSGSATSNDGNPAAISEPAQQEASETDEAAANPTPGATVEIPTQPSNQAISQIALADEQILVLPGGDPPTFDPHLSGDATSAEYVVEIFSGLMTYDLDLNLITDIAESYQVSDDGLVYTFKIRPEAKFQDGKPVRAQDFKYSFERACDPATRSHTADTYLGDIIGCREKLQGLVTEVAGVEVVDDLTLRLTIDEPKGFFLAKMTYPTAYVLDQENVENGGSAWFRQPNGSGPFKLAEVSPNMIVLEKNENFYGDPPPVLDQVIYLINVPVALLDGYEDGFPEDIAGQLGLPDNLTYDVIPVGLANYAKLTDPYNALSQDFTTTNGLSVFYIGFNVNKPPFDDPNIRQAFNLALDRERLVKALYRGTTPAANAIVPPGMPGYDNSDLRGYPFDPERARQLIAQSSYGSVDNLPPITLNVSGAGDIEEAIVRSYEENLGLTIEVEDMPWPDFLQDLNQRDIPYQMYELGWVADYPDPQNFLEILFHSQSAQNHGGYSNPEVDALLDEARGTLDDDERAALYRQAEQLILDDAVWIPLTFDAGHWLIKPYVQNYRIPPMRVPKFQHVAIAEH